MRSSISPNSVEKFNPYHDQIGRFTDPYHFVSFTSQTRDPNKQHWANSATASEIADLVFEKIMKAISDFFAQITAWFENLFAGNKK